MLPIRIFREEWDVNRKLAETFGVLRDDFIPIINEVVGARALKVDNDPVNAAGQFAYIFGTRNTRAMFRSNGYHLHRENGIECVKHPEQNLKITYQSVDFAALVNHEPRAISGKGPGSEKTIDLAQGCLFSNEELSSLNQKNVELYSIRTGLWHFCVSVNSATDVCAELSLVSGIVGGNFGKFIERIFIVNPGEWEKLSINGEQDSGDAVEFEPVVSRK
jgi:hypothetical protein